MSRENNHKPNANLPDTPYKGLDPYSETDAPFFFGRESEWEIITDNLMATRLTLLYGASGVGKSSLLRAGVTHHLLQDAKKNLAEYGTPEFAVVVFNSWQDDPLADLVKQVEKDIKSLLKGKTFAPLSSLLELDKILEIWYERLDEKEGGGELLIVLDQFEEYFLYHPNEKGAGTFAAEFPRAVNRPDLPVNFLISIREDSLAKLDRFKTSIPNLFNNLLRVKHLDPQSAHDAISKPIEVYNDLSPHEEAININEGLVKVVIDQVSQVVRGNNGLGISRESRVELEKQIEAPYLQLVMECLWKEEIEHNKSNSLRLQTLLDMGGADKIVSDHLSRQMKLLRQDEGETSVVAVGKIFQYLVTPSGSKIAYPLKDLIEHTGWSKDKLRKLLEKLASGNYRLLRKVSKSSEVDSERYEIFHDVLAQPILDWRKQYCLDEEKHRRSRSIKKALPAQALRQQRRRQDELAALLARQAYLFNQQDARCQVSDQVDEALREILSVPYFSNILQYSSPIYSVAFSPDSKILAVGDSNGTIHLWNLQDKSVTKVLKGHEGVVNSITFSPDRDNLTLASGGKDQTIRIWDLRQQQIMLTVLKAHKQQVTSVAFSLDGKTLTSGSYDQTIQLWNWRQTDAKPIGSCEHDKIVRTVAFSRDNQWMASGGDDCTVRLWNLQKPSTEPIVRRGHEKIVRTVAFSPDGKILASGSDDWTIRLWDLSQSKTTPPEILQGHKERIRIVTFSPDGQTLASGSDDQTIRLWNLQQPNQKPKVLKGHYFDIHSLTFSPDGQMLVSGSGDYTVRLWDLRQPSAEPQVLKDHAKNILAVAFSPNGQMLASGSLDETVRLWNLQRSNEPPKVLSGHTAQVRSVAFNPKRQILASGSADKTVRLWNLQQPNESLEVLSGHEDGVSTVAFSPDGQRLASGSWKKDKTIRLWDLNQLWHYPIVLRGHKDSITSVAFSPDGKMLASGSDDKTIKLWSLGQPHADSIVLNGHQGRVWSVAFSPDGKMLASSSDDKTIRLWKLEQPDAKPIILRGHNTWVSSIAFSQDGKTLASGSYDRSIRLWNLSQLDEEPIVLEGHEQSVTSVAFSSDGKTVASGSYDNTIRLWNTSTKELADMVCQKVWRNLRMEEWQKFMGSDIPYEQTCPNLPLGEGTSEVARRKEEVSELEREFQDKLAQLLPGQKYVLRFIEHNIDRQPDISEEDVTNYLDKPKGDPGTFYRLETLRLLDFLEITYRDHEPGTIRYGLSANYKKYRSLTKAQQAE